MLLKEYSKKGKMHIRHFFTTKKCIRINFLKILWILFPVLYTKGRYGSFSDSFPFFSHSFQEAVYFQDHFNIQVGLRSSNINQ